MVLGSSFWVLGSGSGFVVLGSGFVVLASGFVVLGSVLVLGSRTRNQEPEPRTQNSEPRTRFYFLCAATYSRAKFFSAGFDRPRSAASFPARSASQPSASIRFTIQKAAARFALAQ